LIAFSAEYNRFRNRIQRSAARKSREGASISILFRWFVGLNLDEKVWDATSFTKNRDRLLEAAVAKEFLAQVVERARVAGLVSDENFTVDGTLLGMIGVSA
jgi:transposase